MGLLCVLNLSIQYHITNQLQRESFLCPPIQSTAHPYPLDFSAFHVRCSLTLFPSYLQSYIRAKKTSKPPKCKLACWPGRSLEQADNNGRHESASPALARLFKRAYFRGIWVVQELVVSSTGVVRCGFYNHIYMLYRSMLNTQLGLYE